MKPLVFLNQVHGDGIKILKQKDNKRLNGLEPGRDTCEADAVITDMKGVILVIQVADCQAVMLFDPQKKVVANIHSGWRGSLKNIIGKCIVEMETVFGCRPENILAGIGPSLGPCCGEFINYRNEIPRSYWGYKQENSDYFDFWAVSRDQLTTAGVIHDNIENMNLCTRCNTDLFYSYRAQNITGRFACVIAMT